MHRTPLLVVASVAALLGGCIFAFDTDYADRLGQDVDSGEDTSLDAVTDVVPDDAGDTVDASPDTLLPDTSSDVADTDADGTDTTDGDAGADADAADVDPTGRNGCGGTSTLRWGVSGRTLGESCGEFGEGTLVCAGTDALYCLGAAPRNDCGTSGVLPEGLLGTDCGCGGTWVCAPEGWPSGLRCVGGLPQNECGGCSALDGRPGYPSCGFGPGVTACDGPESLQCVTSGNACGGAGTLDLPSFVSGEPVPGAVCNRGCGDGIVICDGANGLACDDGHATNACGGCTLLAFEPETPCGSGDAVWTCVDGNQLDCPGNAPPNDCGGTIELSAAPGAACDGGGVLVCDRGELHCSYAGALANACGGTAVLDGTPGAACGDCNNGVWVCETPDNVVCRDEGLPNACGGCAPVAGYDGGACGACADGVLVCSPDDESLACEGALASANECGSCGELGPELGAQCGGCGTWECEAGRPRCQLPEGGCPPPTCATVGPQCDSLGRVCNDGGGEAACGDCLDGYNDVEGICVATDGVVTGVAASNAESSEHVEITWNEFAGAIGYHVYRDGDRITTTPVAGLVYRDTAAAAPGPCAPPTTVAATQNRVNNVIVTWSAASCPNGATHRYQVTAVSAGETESPRSAGASGARARLPATGYEVSIADGPWLTASIGSGYVDDEAPSAQYLPGTADASDGDSLLSVTITLPSARSEPGESRRYRVRALNAAGPGLPSAEAQGWRVLGEVRRYYWQRSAGISNGDYSEIGSTSFNLYEDLLAPATGAARWYRAVVEVEGLGFITSEPDTGYRRTL